MALREFTDDDDREWHVWDITPEKMHPSTRAEDYLQGVLEGWLVFEALDGRGKARLYPIPVDWESASEDDLRAHLRRADRVREPGERKSGPTRVLGGEVAAEDGASRHGVTDREVARTGSASLDVRTFRFPTGRLWTVAERAQGEHANGQSLLVLRFSSGTRSLDMEAFPADWMSYSNDQLIDLLCVAFPRPSVNIASDGAHHRRRGDTTRG